jgi:hypothetical protein
MESHVCIESGSVYHVDNFSHATTELPSCTYKSHM